MARSAAWLGKALRSEARADVRGMLSACARGLDALDEHRLTMGATELRALATGHGAELAELALRDALRRDDPSSLLVWGERWRATALTVPPVRPSDDEQLVGDLAALRDVVRRLDGGQRDVTLDRERRRLEKAVRERALRAQGQALRGSTARFDVDELVGALGETVLVELIEVDDVLHAVVVRDREDQPAHRRAGSDGSGRGRAVAVPVAVAGPRAVAAWSLTRRSRCAARRGDPRVGPGSAVTGRW